MAKGIAALRRNGDSGVGTNELDSELRDLVFAGPLPSYYQRYAASPSHCKGINATPGTIEQVTGLFILVFDGRGGFTVPAPIIVKGALSGLFPDQPGTGTYTIDADCTGRFSVNLPQLPAPLENSMVVLKSGKEFRSVVVSPQPVMITVSGVKIE